MSNHAIINQTVEYAAADIEGATGWSF